MLVKKENTGKLSRKLMSKTLARILGEKTLKVINGL